MARYLDTTWCDGCGVEINWGPIVHHDRIYCCQDCREGRPCDCGRRMELEEERRGRTAEAASPSYPAGE